MTLINYVNRVHFADDILEEALWAELDQRKIRSVLVVSGTELLGGDLGERFRAGLPRYTRSTEHHAGIGHPEERDAQSIARLFKKRDCEALIAFGPGPVIDFTKLVRFMVANDGTPGPTLTATSSSLRIIGRLPDMIAIPTLKGFASGFNGSVTLRIETGDVIDVANRRLVPDVTICDPTIAAMDPAETQASAGATAIARCVEALLSPNYNPPADGIAQDGLNRALRSLRRATRTTEIEPRRDLMAASMNAAMVQQKGLGVIHAISNALDTVTARTLDRGALARLILPELLTYYSSITPIENQALNSAFGKTDSAAIVSGLRSLFSGLPLPCSLNDMGIEDHQIARAAPLAARHRALSNGPRHPGSADILSILHPIA